MAKRAKQGRVSYEADHYGDEPDLKGSPSNLAIIEAYNWYGHYHDSEDAKKFVLAYFSKDKKKKALIEKIEAHELYNIGWNCRILSRGGNLPEEIVKRTVDKLNVLMAKVVEAQKAAAKAKGTDESGKVISVQERVENYASTLIADLEDQIDIFIRKGESDFDASAWFTKMHVKPMVAKVIGEYYTPLYAELAVAHTRKDDEVNEGYSHLKKRQVKKYMEFVKAIVLAAEAQQVVVKATRKPRKKKEKPAAVLVGKMKYLKKDEVHSLESINPTDIIGSQQLWVFNVKTRVLAVYNAMGPAGLSVKGSTIIGFDETSSIAKKLRKPLQILSDVKTGGKVMLKKIMTVVKTKEMVATGRINRDCVLIRSCK